MTLSPSRNRLLAFGILAIVVGVVIVGIQSLVDTYSAQRDEIATVRDALTRFQKIAGERPALERQRNELARAEIGRSAYMTAATDSVAAANLQKLVKATVERSGGALQSTHVKPTRPDDAFRRIGLRVQMTATVDQLRGILHTLEANQPYLFVESLDLRARQTSRSSRAGVTEDRTLELRLDLYALMRPST
jgi:general secretion pathway protein M